MKIALIGYGKMGKAIDAEIENMQQQQQKNAPEVVLKIDANNLDELTAENLRKADVAIEFTTPETAYENILKCFEADIPVVCGSTGWTQRLPELQKMCEQKKKTLFYASNFSIGVNIFFELNKMLARLMDQQQQYDVSIHEIHHTEKKDAPSGTAITLAEGILQEMQRKSKWINAAAKKTEELAVRSYREKDVPGVHLVNYESDFDSIEIKHTAHSRRGFALGAVHAALWLKGKKGFFQMKDMMGLQQ